MTLANELAVGNGVVGGGFRGAGDKQEGGGGVERAGSDECDLGWDFCSAINRAVAVGTDLCMA